MRLTSQFKKTAEDVSDASKQVVETSQTAHVVLLATLAVAVLALVVGIVALNKETRNA